ncbi:protein VACUOLELESS GAMETOPHYTES-like [Apium graveolens]|uniref:protein VACUOLELESS GAMETOPHYTES-like n=1 Tax=Apium graveolens TaxID=4045 RepID=UPI003D7A33B7
MIHEHQLALGNKNAKTLAPYLNRKLEDTELLICDGCAKPISLVDEIFYECKSCNFFLHRSCALFPEKTEHHLAGKLDERVLARAVHLLDFKKCQGCNMFGNGIFLWNETACFDIGCASLPKKIKHEAHRHPLNQLKSPGDDYYCKACANDFEEGTDCIIYGCEKCEFYVHTKCAIRLTHLVKHRLDTHPLYLILSSKNVADHPHEYECEFCSKQIYPGGWFYHCNTCDLSFHNHCIDPYDWLSNLKLGATNIYSDAHPHGLTLILNKRS